MPTTTRRHRQPKPVTGSARWIAKPSGPILWGRLAITSSNGQTTEYDFQAFTEGEKIAGFGLAKDDDEVYSIAVTKHGWECSCPDASWNGRECKHVKAVRAALASVGITITAPKPEAPKQPESKHEVGPPLNREPWCRHCNDDPDVYCSHCSL